MSTNEMRKFNIKELRDVKEGVWIVSVDGDEWLLKSDLILLHRSNRNRRNNLSMHRQCEVKSFYHAMKYIKSHSERLFKKPTKQSRIEFLFTLI